MAGTLPLEDDKYPATLSTDRQIPIRAVTMEAGETIIFSVIATDLAGNVREAVAPALTVDVTEPLIEGFRLFLFQNLKLQLVVDYKLSKRFETVTSGLIVHMSMLVFERFQMYKAKKLNLQHE